MRTVFNTALLLTFATLFFMMFGALIDSTEKALERNVQTANELIALAESRGGNGR